MKTQSRVIAAVVVLMSMLLASCSSTDSSGGQKSSGNTLHIVAATELKGLEGALDKASSDLGFDISVEFPDGTLTNSRSLADGSFDATADATWFATNRYVDLLGASGKLADSTKIASSPVAFGVNSSIAREYGWTTTQPSWSEIIDAARSGHFTFGMTDPSSSNSGFSALVSVATAQADTGPALTEADIAQVTPQLTEFFRAQKLTSGSSGWLAQTFTEHPESANAIINYESVLHQLKDQGTDIEVVVPRDGVISADYPLSTLASPSHDGAREQVAALAKWFEEHPEELTGEFLRPTTGGGELPTDMATTSVIELPFPGSIEITDQLLAAYTNEMRTPGSTAFVLDTSGSMYGPRIDALKKTLGELIDGTAQTPTGPIGFRGNETVTLLLFSAAPYDPTTVTFHPTDAAVKRQLHSVVDGYEADGPTAMYDALADAYSRIDTGGESIPSIVLMSDGEVTNGMSLARFKQFHAGLTAEQQRVPVFVILYGEVNTSEMKQVADLTGGKVFDALGGDLGSAFKEIRAYQ